MPKNFNKQFSAENVCGILLKNGLISDAQQKEIFKKRLSFQGGLEPIIPRVILQTLPFTGKRR